MDTCDELGTPIAASSVRFHTIILECSHSGSRTDCPHEARSCLQALPVRLTVAKIVLGTCSQHVGTPIRAQVLVMTTCWPPGCDLDRSEHTRTVCAKIYESEIRCEYFGLRRHTQSSVPCSPALGDALSSWNQSESPKESKVCSIDHFYRSCANSRRLLCEDIETMRES